MTEYDVDELRAKLRKRWPNTHVVEWITVAAFVLNTLIPAVLQLCLLIVGGYELYRWHLQEATVSLVLFVVAEVVHHRRSAND